MLENPFCSLKRVLQHPLLKTYKVYLMFLVFWLGLTAMVTQILLLRELLEQFSGNELAISIILGSWLFWTALGSFLFTVFAGGKARRRDVFISHILWLVAILIPLLLLLCKTIRLFWGGMAGEIMGADKILVTSLILAAPVCLLLGGLFVLYIERFLELNLEKPTGVIYITEAVGASAGGLLFTFVLVGWFSAFQIAYGLGLVNLILACWLNRKNLWITCLGITIVFLSWGGVYYVEFTYPNLDWPGYQVLKKMNTVYGSLVVASRAKGDVSFFSDRHHLLSVPDLLSAEESVHWAALQPAQLRTVLMIGGIGESVGEILKYPQIEKVTVVELDAGLINLAHEFFPARARGYLQDRRVTIVNGDGRLFIKTTTEKYDLVLLNLPDPATANLNRFYTVEFFAQVRRVLTERGVFSFSVSGAQNYYRQAQLSLLKSLRESLREVFPHIALLPGERVIFLATSKDPLATEAAAYAKLLKRAGVATSYVSWAYIPDRLEPGSFLAFQAALDNTGKYFLNRDFNPLSYYYNLILWSDYFNEKWGLILKQYLDLDLRWLWYCLGFGWALLYLLRILGLFPARLRPTVSVLTTSFAGMSNELILILCFQIFYGDVYQKIGLILACYMMGLALGGYLVLRAKIERRQRFYYLALQGAIALFPLVNIMCLYWLKGQKNYLAINFALAALTAVVGLLGGVQFPLAVEITRLEKKNEKALGGILYSLDLLGAMLGAFFLLSFFVPLAGIYQTLLFLSGLNVAAFIFLL